MVKRSQGGVEMNKLHGITALVVSVFVFNFTTASTLQRSQNTKETNKRFILDSEFNKDPKLLKQDTDFVVNPKFELNLNKNELLPKGIIHLD